MRHQPTALRLCVAIALASSIGSTSSLAEEKPATVIENGKSVTLEYTLKTDDGNTADSNVGREPLVYTQGSSQLLPALEAALLGLAVSESKQITLSAEDGYGPVNPGLVQTVPSEQIPEDGRHVGATLVAQARDGKQRAVRVTEVREKEVVVDLNHPLAGQKLYFDVKVLKIE